MGALKIYRIFLRKDEEGVYTAIAPALPGCITWGKSIEHALEMVKEAVKGYIEVLKRAGEAIPDDNETLEYSFQLTI